MTKEQQMISFLRDDWYYLFRPQALKLGENVRQLVYVFMEDRIKIPNRMNVSILKIEWPELDELNELEYTGKHKGIFPVFVKRG